MKRKVFGNKVFDKNKDVKLAYLWIFDAYPKLSYLNKDLNFGSLSTFELRSSGNKTYELIENFNDRYLDSFFESNLNVSCIVGMNGAGKTTLLRTLQYIINEDTIHGLSHGVIERSFRYFAIFQIDGLFYYRLRNIEGITIFKDGSPIKSTFDEYKSEQTSIYYSGYPDLSYEYNFDRPGYIDVSTGFLVHKKYNRKDEENDEKQVTYFNREDIKMQLAFLSHVETEKKTKRDFDFIDRFIPLTGQVACYGYIQKFDTQARYIDYGSINVYEFLRENFQYLESNLVHEIREDKSDDRNHKLSKSNKSKMATLFLIRFYARLVEQFYYNLEYREHKGKDYRKKLTDDIKESLPEKDIAAYRIFFEQQILIVENRKQEFLNYLSSVEALSKNLVWNINEQFFDCDLGTMKTLVSIERSILQLFPHRSKLTLFHFQWHGISTGEKAMLSLFSRLHEAAEVRSLFFSEKKRLFFLLDEPEIAYHPHWQQEYLSYIIKYINWRFKEYSKHLIICTHSPFILSDIPDYSVIKLGEAPSAVYERKTLGANIYDLLADSFYLPSGFMGVIAQEKILGLTNSLIKKDKKLNRINAQKLINLIGEPLIKDRLQSLFNERFDKEPTREELKQRIVDLEAQLTDRKSALKKKRK